MAYVEKGDDFILRVAEIFGAQSAAAKAIEERDRRRAKGEQVVVLWDSDRGVISVAPTPARKEVGDG